jgi:S1-C subfamily serine protease/Tfp pilus assembly protein PilF
VIRARLPRRNHANWIIRLSVFATSLLLGAYRAQGQGGQTPSTIFRNAKPSVVYIIAGDSNGNPTVQGSGFIIGKDRVVTNHHVLVGTSTAIALFSDGRSSPITTVIADSGPKDLIVVGAETGQRPAVMLGDELALQEGDPVYAIGAPKGLELSLTDGIVSSFRNSGDEFLIQSTAAIGHGSSGGPLFNREGRVVGITAALMSDTPGIYFSIGVGDLKRLLRNPQLMVDEFSDWAKRNPSVSESAPEAEASSTTQTVSQIEKLLHEGKFDEARAQIQTFTAATPESALSYRLFGEFNQKTGHADEALSDLQLSVDKDPRDSISQFYLAISLFRARRFDEALTHEVKSNELGPSDADTPLLAMLYYAVRDFKQAEAKARKAVQADPKNETALSVLAGLTFHGLSSRDEKWFTYVQTLSAVNPDSFWSHVLQGYVAQRDSKDNEAIAAFKAAESDSFPDSAAYHALASVYSSESEFGRANDEIKAGLVDMPNDPYLLSSGIFFSLITREDTEAARRFELLDHLYSGSRETLAAGCLYYYGIGQSNSALPYCTQLTTQFPNDRTAHSNYGYAALDANQSQIALAEFSTAYKIASPDWNKLTQTQAIDLLWGCAMSLYDTGDKKNAGEIIRSIRKDYPSAATITGLQQLPLLWSKITMTRIEALLNEFPHQ